MESFIDNIRQEGEERRKKEEQRWEERGVVSDIDTLPLGKTLLRSTLTTKTKTDSRMKWVQKRHAIIPC